MVLIVFWVFTAAIHAVGSSRHDVTHMSFLATGVQSSAFHHQVARLGKKSPIRLLVATIGSQKFGFGALLLVGLLLESLWSPGVCRIDPIHFLAR